MGKAGRIRICTDHDSQSNFCRCRGDSGIITHQIQILAMTAVSDAFETADQPILLEKDDLENAKLVVSVGDEEYKTDIEN